VSRSLGVWVRACDGGCSWFRRSGPYVAVDDVAVGRFALHLVNCGDCYEKATILYLVGILE
jgi:hypothetical protein